MKETPAAIFSSIADNIELKHSFLVIFVYS